jgi:hypothetical protein
MFTIHWMDEAADDFAALTDKAEAALNSRKSKGKTKSSKIEGLFKQVYKAVELLRANPKHPGLNTHAYDSITNPFDKDAKVFEAYAQNATPGAFRIFWCYGPGTREITIIAITPHP